MLLYLCLGVLLRAWLFAFFEITSWLSKRPEISTPVTSWNRVVEGVSLFKQSGLLHEGDSYHGSSLLLLFISTLQEFSPHLINVVFVVCDVVSSLALFGFAKKFLKREIRSQSECKNDISPDSKTILLNEGHILKVPLLISMLYLFNPFTLVTCLSKSTLTFNNMFLVLFLHDAVSGKVISATLFLALASYESLYPIGLLFAAALCHHKYQSGNLSPLLCIITTTACYVAWMVMLLFLSYMYDGSLASITAHFTFILSVPDQTPNVGVFWYFFTEVFDHFRTFFLCLFQMNVVFFSLPMSIKLRSHPVCLCFVLIGVMSIMKSYPSLGDAGLWLSIIPLWSHTFRYLRVATVMSVTLVTSTVVCPVMWNMWIGARSANANFFFAATLAYTTAQILLLTDILLAYMKWHYHLRQGLDPKVSDSKEKAVIRLVN